MFLRLFRWITNSAEAGIFLVFANVDPSKGYKGITCFALDKEMGVTIAKKEKKVSRGLAGPVIRMCTDLIWLMRA
jgi:alkylation response protein AidB-like acyl-CoA dehydrogenase